ncbi:hypothetical protein D9M71_494070 [compost metagenome]
MILLAWLVLADPRITMLLLSVAPAVNISSFVRQPSRVAIVEVLSQMALFASRPMRCEEDGFPKVLLLSSCISFKTSSEHGVVDAASK